MADKAQTLMQLFMEALLTLVGDDAKVRKTHRNLRREREPTSQLSR